MDDLPERQAWEQADDDDMRELAEAEQRDNTIGPPINAQAEYALGLTAKPGLMMQPITRDQLRSLSAELEKQGATRRPYFPGYNVLQAQAEDAVKRSRELLLEEQRQDALRLYALELAKQGIDTNVRAKYMPKLIAADTVSGEGLISIAVSVEVCSGCRKWMINRSLASFGRNIYKDGIGIGYDNGLQQQINRADVRVCSDVVDSKRRPICEECKAAGKSTVICWLCKQERSSELIKHSYGYDPPSEYLCTVCYESVPAARWDKATTDLEEKHRYDNE